MSLERRSEIYVTYKLKMRLRSVIKLYPQTVDQEVRSDFGIRTIQPRLMTVEELVERILNDHIEKHYPVVLEAEKEIAAIEKRMAEKVKDSSDGNTDGI